MKKIIAANWKMKLNYSESLALAREYRASRLIRESKRRIIVCPDFISAGPVAKILLGGPVAVGAQDAAAMVRGANTGEVSPADLKSLGLEYVILGHSERREQLREDSALVAAKAKAALASGLIPIICLGERLVERQSGQTRKYLRTELARSLRGLEPKMAGRIIIAYEPVWAISSAPGARPMVPSEADAVQTFIKAEALKITKKRAPVLYGGSVNSANAAQYLKMKNIDGLLVGAAALTLAEFEKMC